MRWISDKKLIVLAISCLLISATAAILRAQLPDSGPYIVGWNEGEILLDPRGRTNSINVSPLRGSTNVAFSTQDMPPGSGIAVHRHDRTEEILFIHSGEATLIIGEDRVPVEAGDTVWVPPGTYHGLENPDSRVQVLGVVTPPGLDQAFREMFWHPGEEPKVLSEDQLAAIGIRFDAVGRSD